MMTGTLALIEPALFGLAGIFFFAGILWLISVRINDVSIVDSAWSLFQLIAALIYFASMPVSASEMINVRAILILALILMWSLRLSIYITLRNWAHPEDYRYREIRERNQPNFAWKSAYLVFGLQAVLAWLLSFPTLAAMTTVSAFTPIDIIGALLFIVGFLFESIGDLQLAHFKKSPENKNKVMNAGLWRYTRHPNYFGEFCMAWGIYLIAVAAGGWWTIFAPLLITFLVLKISGVALMEKSIGERRPGYREYINNTNAFFPGPTRSSSLSQ
jgi:steroid 5-alpha reductase family enzyme